MASSKEVDGGALLDEVPESERDRVRQMLRHLTSELEIDPVPEPFFRDFGGIHVGDGCKGEPRLYMGPEILATLRSSSPRGLALVLAHEIGHFLQFRQSPKFRDAFCSGEIKSHRQAELVADLVAGYAMRSVYMVDGADDLIITVSVLSDYEFASLDHHGRVNERVNAFNLGQALAQMGKPLDVDKFMTNQDSFMEILGGPSLSGLTADLVEHYSQEAIMRLYQ